MPVVKWLVIKLLRGLQPKPAMSRSKGTSNHMLFLSFGASRSTPTFWASLTPSPAWFSSSFHKSYCAKSHNHSTALTARPPLSFFPKLNVPTSQSSAICSYLPETFPGWQWCHSPKVIAKKKVQLGIERLENCFIVYINSVSSQWIWSVSPETLVMYIISAKTSCLFLPRKMPPKWPSALVSRH